MVQQFVYSLTVSNALATVNKKNFNEKRSQCKSERKFFIEQVKWELDDCDWQQFHEIEDIKPQINLFEKRLVKFYKICGELEGLFGGEIAEFNLNDENEYLITFIREKLNLGKVRIGEIRKEKEVIEKERLQKIMVEKDLAEKNRIELEKLELQEKIENLLDCAENFAF